MKKKLIFFLFFILLVSTISGLNYRDYVVSWTNSSYDKVGCPAGQCIGSKIYDGVNTSGADSSNEWIAERSVNYPDQENVVLDFGENTLLGVDAINVSLSCTIGGDQNPEGIEIYSSTGSGYSLVAQRSFQPISCGGTCNTGEPYNFNIPLISSSFNTNDLKIVINRSNCTILDGINELHLDFSSNSTNQLPEFNVSPEKAYVCINNSETLPITINLDWSVYDLEGDKIYYAKTISDGGYNYDWKAYSFDTDNAWNTYLTSNGSIYTGIDRITCLNDWNSEPCLTIDDGLYIKKGSEEALVIPGEKYSNQSWIWYDIQLKSDTVVNINYYDEYFVGDTTTYNFTDYGNLTVYINDVLKYNNVFQNYSNDEVLTMTTSLVDWECNYLLYDYNSDLILNSTQACSRNSLKYVGIESKDTYFHDPTKQNYFKFKYLAIGGFIHIENIDFSTIQPTEISIEHIGEYPYTYYVSDSIHQPGQYDFKTFTIKVEQKKYCYGEFDKDKITDLVIGNTMQSFLRTMNLEKFFGSALFIVFLILTIIFSVGMWKASGNIVLNIPLVISSVICFLLSFLFMQAIPMVTYLSTLALSLVWVFLGRGNLQ